MRPGSRTAVFLDRDGVIIRERPGYVLSPEEVDPLPGALEAIARLSQSGLLVAIVTNQSALGRGLIDGGGLEAVHERIRHLAESAGGRIDAVLVCPHLPGSGCVCRKPRPGLLVEAALRFGVDLPSSFMVGDQVTDIRAARAAGCRPVLVLTGQTQERPADLGADCITADDLWAASQMILALGPVPPRVAVRASRS